MASPNVKLAAIIIEEKDTLNTVCDFFNLLLEVSRLFPVVVYGEARSPITC